MHDIGRGLFEEIEELRAALRSYRAGHPKCFLRASRDTRCQRCKDADRAMCDEPGAAAIAAVASVVRHG